MDGLDTLNKAGALFSSPERAALLKGLHEGGITKECLEDLAKARRRTVKKTRSDKRTDAERRQLVGARVEKERYERYKDVAEAKGVSLYRFTVDALDKALEQAF